MSESFGLGMAWLHWHLRRMSDKGFCYDSERKRARSRHWKSGCSDPFWELNP